MPMKRTGESKAFGRFLRELRGRLSTREVSRISRDIAHHPAERIAASYISHLESGADIEPSPFKILTLARIYEVAPEEILAAAPSRYKDNLLAQLTPIMAARRALERMAPGTQAQADILRYWYSDCFGLLVRSLLYVYLKNGMGEEVSVFLRDAADLIERVGRLYKEEPGKDHDDVLRESGVFKAAFEREDAPLTKDSIRSLPGWIEEQLKELVEGIFDEGGPNARPQEGASILGGILRRFPGRRCLGSAESSWFPVREFVRSLLKRRARECGAEGFRLSPWSEEEFLSRPEEDQEADSDLAPPGLRKTTKKGQGRKSSKKRVQAKRKGKGDE